MSPLSSSSSGRKCSRSYTACRSTTKPQGVVVVGTRKAWRSSSSTRTPCEEDFRVCANQRNSGCSASVLHPHAEVTGFARRAMTPNAPVTAVISFCVLVSREAVLPTDDHVYDVKYTTRKPTQLTVTPIAEYELVNMSGRNSYFEPKMMRCISEQ